LKYSYTVQATNSGGSSARSAAVLWTTIPATPTRLTVETNGASAGSVYISWNASSGATSYQLYRNDTQVYNGGDGFHHDTGLTAGTTYSYTVEATNSRGSSARSAALLWTTIAATPTGLTVGSATVSSLSISWDASTGATSYQLYRNGTHVYNGGANAYTDTGLTSSTKYSYTVQASNNGGSSALSMAVLGTTLP
jgi:chitodextrinase